MSQSSSVEVRDPARHGGGGGIARHDAVYFINLIMNPSGFNVTVNVILNSISP